MTNDERDRADLPADDIRADTPDEAIESAGQGPSDGPGEDKQADAPDGALSPGSTANGSPTGLGA